MTAPVIATQTPILEIITTSGCAIPITSPKAKLDTPIPNPHTKTLVPMAVE